MHDSSAAPNFTTTHWSLVLAAKPDVVSQTQAHRALDALCQAYWFPLYSFIRRRGYAAADAQDLTQSFLLAFIERQGFFAADPERGRFRSYLLGALKHFLAHDRERRSAKKRGGDAVVVELDALEPEARYQLEPMGAIDPEASFDRDWAQEVNSRALEKLQSEYQRQGKQRQFSVLKGCLVDDGFDRNKAAHELGGTDGATKVAIHRLRKRYRELLRSEISMTLNDPEDVDGEMKCLVAALVAP